MKVKQIMAGLLAAVISVTSVTIPIFAQSEALPAAADTQSAEIVETDPQPVSPQKATSGDYTYSTYNSKTAYIVGYSGKAANLTIPSTIDGYKITGIGDYAFRYNYTLKSVTIPDTVTSVGYSAFNECEALQTVNLGKGVKTISDYAFEECISLKSITIPDNVTAIGDCAFSNCTKLSSVSIGKGITSIPGRCFEDCTSLSSITIPDNIETIGYQAFSDCTGLKTLKIGKGVNYIEDGAFYYCNSLTSVTIPGNVETVSSSSFKGCSSLKTLTLSDGIKNIGSNAFEECVLLTKITIPKSVQRIGYKAFRGCKYLTAINVDKNNKCFKSVNGVLFDKYGETLVACPGAKQGKYTVPKGVIRIYNHAFYNCQDITAVTLPSSVIEIDHNAFDGCIKLSKVTLNKGLEIIDTEAFSRCAALAKITIPSTVKTIGYGAFLNCSALSSVTLGSSLERIGYSAFENCEKLGSIKIPASVLEIGNYAFSNTKVLNFQTNDLKYVDSWLIKANSSIKKAEVKKGTRGIAESAFYGCASLTSVTLPSTLKAINSKAFYNCTSLKSLSVPKSVVEVGSESMGYYSDDDSYYYNSLVSDKFLLTCTPNSEAEDYAINRNVKYKLKTCSKHTYGSWKTKAATCTERGYKLRVCTKCGCEDKVSSGKAPAHKFGTWKVIIPASCNNSGSLQSTCSVCGQIRYNSIGSTSHEYTNVYYAKENGQKRVQTHCKFCGAIGEDSLLKVCTKATSLKSASPLNEYDVTSYYYKDPDAKSLKITFSADTQLDSWYDQLSLYNFVTKRWVQLNGYDNKVAGNSFIVNGNVILLKLSTRASGCKGFTVSKVERYDNTVPAVHTHTFSEWKVTKKPTCNKAGSKVHTCACGAKETVAIAPTEAHIFSMTYKKSKFSCTSPTTETGTCYLCGKKDVSVLAAATATSHTYKKVKTVKPTYFAKGYTLHKCTICGATKKTNITKKLVLAKPASVKATTVSSNSVKLSWKKNANASGYIIEVYNGKKWVKKGKVTKNSTVSYTVTKLSKASTTYKFRVKAYKLKGKTAVYSPVSATVSAKTAPSAIKGLKVYARGKTSVTISWTKNTSAAGYVVQVFKNGKWVNFKTITSAKTTSCKVTGLKPNTKYNFRVRAYANNGKSKLYGSYATIVNISTLK